MTPEELDQLQEELEEYLPTSLQVKLSKLFDLVRKDDPIRKEWVENQRKILGEKKRNYGNLTSQLDYPHHHFLNHKKTTKKLDENQKKIREKPEKNYGLSA